MDDTTDSVIRSLLPLVKALEYLGIKYYIGGSLASSAYGISRPTQDADVVADIHTEHIYLLTRSLEAEYYIDADMIRDAIRKVDPCVNTLGKAVLRATLLLFLFQNSLLSCW